MSFWKYFGFFYFIKTLFGKNKNAKIPLCGQSNKTVDKTDLENRYYDHPDMVEDFESILDTIDLDSLDRDAGLYEDINNDRDLFMDELDDFDLDNDELDDIDILNDLDFDRDWSFGRDMSHDDFDRDWLNDDY